jgi:amino acid transporter
MSAKTPIQAAIQDRAPAETHRLKRELALRDLVLTQILSVVGSTWVGIAAGLGRAQAIVWISAMLLFYLPMAISVYFLNREMPLEGGLYVWAREAFGDTGGFMTAWNIWGYGLCITATLLFELPSAFAYMVGPAAAGLPENHLFVFAMVAIGLVLLTFTAVRGLAIAKWIHNFSGAAMLAIFVLLILSPLWALAHHQPVHYAPLAMKLPHADLVSLALIGQMFGALSGLEYVAILAGETNRPARNIGLSVVLSSPVICAMFILGTGAVVAFHELHPGIVIDYIAPIPQTLRIALGVATGSNAGAEFIIRTAIFLLQMRILGAASFIFTGVTRLPMTAGWDHLVPEWFTRLNPRRLTPVNSILASSGAVAVLIVLASLGVHAAEAFQVLNNASTEQYSLAYLAMFAIPVFGRAALRLRFPSWVILSSVVGMVSTLFAAFVSAYPFVAVVSPAAYAAKILGTTLLANVVGYAFYRVRNRARRA